MSGDTTEIEAESRDYIRRRIRNALSRKARQEIQNRVDKAQTDEQIPTSSKVLVALGVAIAGLLLFIGIVLLQKIL